MAYIKKDDYTLRIPLEHLDEILVQAAEASGFSEDEIRLDAEETAMEEIGSILRGVYLIDDEFARDAGAALDFRNKVILKCTMDIALYHLHWVINPRDVPLTREKAYEMCIEKMKAYRDGELTLSPIDPEDPGAGINPLPPEDGGISRIELISHRKFISKPYVDPALKDDEIETP